MRVEIELSDQQFKELNARASELGIAMEDLVTRAIERELSGSAEEEGLRFQFPLVSSDAPGSISPDTDSIATLFDTEDSYPGM